jgi:predicted unusual protein kinase regulating ubiquinone biosynthesis (AarF/ABC1/UbiB family)
LASIWNLFGSELSDRIRGLRDRARPMTRQEVLDVLRDTLETGDQKRIHLKEILGSASTLGRAFLEKLAERGVDLPTPMLQMLTYSLEEQLAEETQMTLEATKIDHAAKEYEALNSLGTESGWSFKVPRVFHGIPPRDNLLFVDLAKGVPFDELPPEIKNEVGPFIVRASLQMLFRKGAFDPDRHFGNWKFDPETRTVYPYDFGQFESYEKNGPWKMDDTTTIARFIQGLDAQRADVLVDAALRMARPSKNPPDRARLIKAVDEALHAKSEDALSGSVTAVVTALCDEGLDFQKKFLFGALKGLLVLSGEGYVNAEQFKSELAVEVKRALVSKAPALFLQSARA